LRWGFRGGDLPGRRGACLHGAEGFNRARLKSRGMGLTIYYGMKTKSGADGARKLVARMYKRIAKLPWDKITEVFEIDPPDGTYLFKKERAGRFKPGDEYLTRKREDGGEDEIVDVPSLHVMYFHARVEGAETASFGLASHPPVVVHRASVVERDADGRKTVRMGAGEAVEVPTRLRGWYTWRAFCKTQYAANPKLGGEKNFLRAHLSVFRAMEICRELGLRTWIRDDGKFQKHRSVEKLLESLRFHDDLVAGFVGRLGDVIAGAGHEGFVAPIKDRADFEHLEAKGAERLRRRAGKKGRRRGG
jgi:hypothetical protein